MRWTCTYPMKITDDCVSSSKFLIPNSHYIITRCIQLRCKKKENGSEFNIILILFATDPLLSFYSNLFGRTRLGFIISTAALVTRFGDENDIRCLDI